MEGKHYSLKKKGKNRNPASELDVCSFRRTKKEEVEELRIVLNGEPAMRITYSKYVLMHVGLPELAYQLQGINLSGKQPEGFRLTAKICTTSSQTMVIVGEVFFFDQFT